MSNNQAMQYRSLELETKVANASPHELIQMLFEGAIERLIQAKACAERGDVSAKGVFLSKALGIVGGLRESLNMEMESDIPQNLDRLYEYIQLRLIRGNLNEDHAAFTECIELIKTIKSGWEGIADEV